jgi:hypothetical protein
MSSFPAFELSVYHFRAMRCVSAAIVSDGDKLPCATGRVRNRIVIITRKRFQNVLVMF